MSRTALLIGEPGVGKTRLLQYAAQTATDLQIMHISGLESEVRLSFAAAHRLLLPHLDRLEKLPAPQRTALELTFGVREGTPPSRFLVGLGTLALLGEVAAEAPSLCLVDDAHWLDQESVAVFGFVARRLHADPFGFIIAAREHAMDMVPLAGLPAVRIGPLDPASGRELLDTTVKGPVEARVAARIVTETGGNPLAMLEIAAQLSTEQLSGRAPLPARLPVGRRIDAHFLQQVEALGPQTRAALLVAASASGDDPATFWRAASLLGLAADSIDPALDRGILTLSPRIMFRHPLIRSAVYQAADRDERRRVHDALGAVADLDGHAEEAAWHRASSRTAPNELIAEDLERAANHAQRRGGYAVQAAFLLRAAELSVGPKQRALRLLAAAGAHLAAGDGVLAEALLDQATPDLDDAGLHIAVQRLRASIAVFFSRHKDAPAILLGAADSIDTADTAAVRAMLFEALQAALVAREYTAGTTLLEIAQRVLAAAPDPQAPPSANDLLLDGFATRIALSYEAAVPLLRNAVTGLFRDETVDPVGIPSIILGWFAADDIWDERGRRAMFERAEAIQRRHGALGAMRITLAGASVGQVWAGEMNAAENSYAEAAEISTLIGVPPPATTGVLLEVRAWQGRDAESRAVADSTAGWGRQQGAAILEIFALMGLTVLELGLARYPDALGWGMRIFHDDPPGFGNRILPEIVEAGVRSDDLNAARAALARLELRAIHSGTPWALGMLARSHALLAADSDAETYYTAAIGHLTGAEVRTELARAHLLYGEWLRRKKRRRDAQNQLRRAYEMFSAMGATSFARRTGAEQRAAGDGARQKARQSGASGLTPQEAQVARQASAGATNAEIASRLFITTSTVEYHLSKVFRKLSITSRRQLADVLARGELGREVDV